MTFDGRHSREQLGRTYHFAGCKAIVTGGGTGIGRATALLLAQNGAAVTLAGRSEESLTSVAKEIGDVRGDAFVCPTDVTKPDQIERLVAHHYERFGQCDVLVNNAGGSYLRDVADWDVASWDNMVNLNLRAVWLACQLIGPRMVERGEGAIVNISSYAVANSMPEVAPYSAAKAGVEHLSAVFASAWGAAGVRTNCVRVGSILSEGYIRAMKRAGRDPSLMGGEKNALTRAGRPDEVAEAVAFLASQAASYINGSVLAADGGRELYRPPTASA